MVDEAIEFLQEFRPAGHWQLTCIDPEGRGIKTCSFDDIDQARRWLENWDGRRNIYFNVNPTISPMGKKALRTDILEVAYLHVDLDPRVGEDIEAEQSRIYALLTSDLPDGVPSPTFVVFSGGGYQAFWKLEQALPINGELALAEDAKLYNLALERTFGADACHNIDRIMRVPGTWNIPDAKKREKGRENARARLVVNQPERAYRIEYFSKAEQVDLTLSDQELVPASGLDTDVSYTLDEFRQAAPCQLSAMEGVPEKALLIAAHGVDAKVKNPPKDRSRSGWFFSMLTTCTSAGVPPDVIAGICKSDELHSSLKALIRDKKGEKYVAHQIATALQKCPHIASGRSSRFSDDHLAWTFAQAHKDDLRYCAATGKWFCWNGTQWEMDATLLVWDLAKEVVRQAVWFLDDDKFKRSLLSKRSISAVESLARSDRRIAIKVETFDADPLWLNTPTCMVDLETGEQFAHQPERYMTKQTAVGPEEGDPGAFLHFLRWAANGDEEIVAYIQRIMGYCLTGSTKEHSLFFVHGPGGNGKSVLQELLVWLLQDYAVTTTFDTLAVSHGTQHPTDLASMKGARLVVAPETEANQLWAEAKIKRMTGGDRISARFMRQDFFEYVPQFKLFVVGNHRPGFNNVDHAIRRRIHLLPFTQVVTKPEFDLAQRLKEEEGGQILAWAIRGAQEWFEGGLRPPDSISVATDEYLQAEDLIQQWLDECTEQKGERTDFSAIYKCYRQWCLDAGEPPLTQKRLGMQLSDRGWPSERGGKGVRQRVISLSPRGMQLLTEATGSINHIPVPF